MSEARERKSLIEPSKSDDYKSTDIPLVKEDDEVAEKPRHFDFEGNKKLSMKYILGGLLSFFMVFSLWCGWVTIVDILSGESTSKVSKQLFLNMAMLVGCGVFGAYLRYFHGPLLGPGARLILSLVLIFGAICFWEVLEGMIRRFANNKNGMLVMIYLVLLICSAAVTFTFEYSTNYDVVGNHLLL